MGAERSRQGLNVYLDPAREADAHRLDDIGSAQLGTSYIHCRNEMIILEKPTTRRQQEFLAAVERSKRLHASWVTASQTSAAFKAYLQRTQGEPHLSYWVITEDHALAGVINLSEIVRGAFCSGYLGYYAFVPHNGKGYMSRGLAAVLEECLSGAWAAPC